MRENENKVAAVVEPENKIDFKEINEKIWLNNISVNKKPTLTISAWCHSHIRALHKEYPNTERLAWCKVENLGNGQFKLVDMIHPQQKWVGAEVEVTDDGMDRMVNYLIEKWEDLGKWNLVLHSHHKMWVFRSWTDDNARKSLNDGRTLAWAVVTAYSWDTISYKGCLNFYKPYPIEIDADIVVEDWDFYEQSVEWGEFIKNRTQEIYNEKVKTDTILNELQCEYDYSRLLDYLWIDILEELKENSKIVAMKMPCEDYKKRLEEIMEESETEAQAECGAPIDNELMQWQEWSDMLLDQLKEARNIPIKATEYKSSYNSWDDYDYWYGWYSQTSKLSNTPTWIDNRDFSDTDYMNGDFYMYNTSNFTKSELMDMLGLNPQFHLMSNQDWLWLIHNTAFDKREYIWDVLDFIYEYEDDYL